MRKFGNVFLLLGAAAVGAAGMWYWDDNVQKFQVHLVEQQLAKGIVQPAADVHTIGLHGEFADVHAHHHDDDGDEGTPLTADQQKRMAIADAKARELFSTPGGAYTAEDIARNGTVPPSERFEKVEFLYSMKAHEGQPVDPILATKTAGAYDWYVGGKRYHFASIASIEEFVIRAKRDPKSILPPDRYVERDGATRVASR